MKWATTTTTPLPTLLLGLRRRLQTWERERKSGQEQQTKKYFQLTESISEHHLTYPFFFSSKTKGWKTRSLSLGKMCQKQNCVEIHPCQSHHVFPFLFFPPVSIHFTSLYFYFYPGIFHHPSSLFSSYSPSSSFPFPVQVQHVSFFSRSFYFLNAHR